MIIFNDAQTENLGFLENHKDEQELAIQMPSGKTYLIKYLTLNGDFENITIIVMSRLIVSSNLLSILQKQWFFTNSSFVVKTIAIMILMGMMMMISKCLN